MAQVKLGFKTGSGAKFAVSRSLQLTVKKNARSMKSLDGSLLMVKDGERTVISQRVGELDTIVPQYLGVSSAVLENVIFCHQEDSLWPMSEPAALKKKFDEIFEALKYTKAIDNLKKLRKAQATELAVLKVHEEQDKANKDKGQKVEKHSRMLLSQIDELRQQAEAIDEEMKIALEAGKEKHMLANDALNIVNELKTKKDQESFLQKQVDSLRNTLEELQESDEWLRSTLEQYEQRMAQYRDQGQEYQLSYQELQQTLSDSRRAMAEKLAEQGQHQAQKKNYERQLQDRAQLVREAARRHGMRGYDGDLDEDQIGEFVSRVRKLSQDKDRELERIKRATDEELKKTQAVLTELDNSRSARTQDRLNARQTIADNERKSTPIQRDLDSISVDEGAKAALEASLRDVQDRFQRATEEYEAAEWDRNLNIENSKLRDFESESERLTAELVQSNKLATDRAHFEHLKKLVKGAQQGLDTMISTHGDQLSSVIGAGWEVDSLEREFQAVLDQRSRSVADAQKQQEGTSHELGEVQFKLKTIREMLKKKKEDMKDCQTTVLNSLTTEEGAPLTSVDDYLEELDLLEQERNSVQKDIDGFAYVTDYYTRCLNDVNSQNKCRLCDRKFADKKERSLALEKINKQLAKDARAALEDDLKRLDADLKKAVAARPQYETFKTLSATEIPALEKELQEAKQRDDELNRVLEQHDSLFNQAMSAKKEVESLSTTVRTITGYRSEISKHEADIARLSSQQKLSGSSLSIEEIDEQQTACSAQIRSLKAKIQKMSSDKEHAKSTMNNLQVEMSSISSKLASAEHALERKRDLLSRLEGLRENTSQLREDIKRADADLEALIPRFEKAKAQHDDAKQRGREKEKEVQVDKDRLADTVNKFNLAEAGINRYLDEGGPQNLAACERAIKALEQDQVRIEGELSQITQKNNDLKKRIDDGERTKRSIEDNLRFRDCLKDLEKVQKEIAELNERNATDDYERLSRDAVNADKRYQKLLAERGPILGSIKSKDEELTKNLQEWETDYQHAAQKYREAHIKVETTKAAIEDLGKYQLALDNAIMQFHSVKMEEINRIAGELWQSTYQGTDVDTIMIRSEKENESSSATTRNYNYRVVMVKQDAEMDMRGRCSAGQKVLASIIIRLALAECFGVQCGVCCPSPNCPTKLLTSSEAHCSRRAYDKSRPRHYQIFGPVSPHDNQDAQSAGQFPAHRYYSR
jgi:DNA repair protein RAD50